MPAALQQLVEKVETRAAERASENTSTPWPNSPRTGKLATYQMPPPAKPTIFIAAFGATITETHPLWSFFDLMRRDSNFVVPAHANEPPRAGISYQFPALRMAGELVTDAQKLFTEGELSAWKKTQQHIDHLAELESQFSRAGALERLKGACARAEKMGENVSAEVLLEIAQLESVSESTGRRARQLAVAALGLYMQKTVRPISVEITRRIHAALVKEFQTTFSQAKATANRVGLTYKIGAPEVILAGECLRAERTVADQEKLGQTGTPRHLLHGFAEL